MKIVKQLACSYLTFPSALLTLAMADNVRGTNSALRRVSLRGSTEGPDFTQCRTVECCDLTAGVYCGFGTADYSRQCHNNVVIVDEDFQQCLVENKNFADNRWSSITNPASGRHLYSPRTFSAGSQSGEVIDEGEWMFMETSGCPEANFRECFWVRNRATDEILGSQGIPYYGILTFPASFLGADEDTARRFRFRFQETTCPSPIHDAEWCGFIVGFDGRALTVLQDSANGEGHVETRPRIDQWSEQQLWVIREEH